MQGALLCFDDAVQHPLSPCVSICRVDPVSGWCEGCRRTLGEIADWPMLSAHEKREIIAQLDSRRTD